MTNSSEGNVQSQQSKNTRKGGGSQFNPKEECNYRDRGPSPMVLSLSLAKDHGYGKNGAVQYQWKLGPLGSTHGARLTLMQPMQVSVNSVNTLPHDYLQRTDQVL